MTFSLNTTIIEPENNNKIKKEGERKTVTYSKDIDKENCKKGKVKMEELKCMDKKYVKVEQRVARMIV